MSKAESTKKYIIETTAPIFNSKGYMGTSLNDITESTGLTKGSIYGNFENKDEVALEAFNYNFNLVVTYISSKINNKQTAIDKLLVYVDTYKNFQKIKFLKAGCPILNTATEADDTHPALREKAMHAIQYWKKSIIKIITDGIKNDEISPKTNPEEISILMISIIEGAVMYTKLTGENKPMIVSMNYLEKLIKNLK